MPFEKYIATRGCKSNIPFVSFYGSGILHVNVYATTTFLNSCKYAYLFFDKKNNVLGIKAALSRVKGTVKLSRSGKRAIQNSQISIGGFLNYFSLTLSVGAKYPAHWNKKLGMLEIDLNKPLKIRHLKKG